MYVCRCPTITRGALRSPKVVLDNIRGSATPLYPQVNPLLVVMNLQFTTLYGIITGSLSADSNIQHGIDANPYSPSL